MGKKIGIFGGSFDPVHNGHLAIAKAAYEDFCLDEVWFIPAGHSPNKDEHTMTSAKLRAEMVSLAIAPYPYFKLCTIEIDSEDTSFTYLTLTKLCEKYPDAQFYFIMGADSLDYFETWKNPDIICQKCILLAAVRGEWNKKEVLSKIKELETLFDARIYPLSCPSFDAASSEIRRKLRQKERIFGLLPIQTEQFIKKHHLYEKE